MAYSVEGRSRGQNRSVATAATRQTVMPSHAEPGKIPDERLSIEKRSDGAVVVRVQSEGPEGARLPDAVFSFRCGDPQYSYWLDRMNHRRSDGTTGRRADG